MTQIEFHNVVNEHSQTMFRYAFSILRSQEKAKDVVQDSLVRLWQEENTLSHYMNLKAYCFTLVKNKCLDVIRSDERRSQNLKTIIRQLPKKSEVEEKLEREDRLNVMFTMLDQLPKNEASILKLRDFEGLAYQEIADILGMSLSNVKVTLFRARKKFNDIIQQAHGIRHADY